MIKRGKLADFVVIDRAYMNFGEKEITRIRVLQTALWRKVVYPVRRASRKCGRGLTVSFSVAFDSFQTGTDLPSPV
jgi:hypothetical protein